MINPASLARAILTTKSVNVESCRRMGRARRGPYDPATCAKVSEALRRLGSMDFAVRREHFFAKRARYLVNVLVTQGDRRVFRLRCAGDDGKMVDLETSIDLDEHPIELLLKLMRMPHAPTVLRLDCAKTTARYLLKRPKVVITVEQQQQRLERRREHKRLYMRKYHQRLSASVASSLADRAAADG